jgi:histidine triad (HIT) family protein
LHACIARNEEHASRIYEDKDVMAFLDKRQVNEGHTLVILRKHYENIFEIPDEELANLFKIVKRVAVAITRSEKADGLRIVQNNGALLTRSYFIFMSISSPSMRDKIRTGA